MTNAFFYLILLVIHTCLETDSSGKQHTIEGVLFGYHLSWWHKLLIHFFLSEFCHGFFDDLSQYWSNDDFGNRKSFTKKVSPFTNSMKCTKWNSLDSFLLVLKSCQCYFAPIYFSSSVTNTWILHQVCPLDSNVPIVLYSYTVIRNWNTYLLSSQHNF